MPGTEQVPLATFVQWVTVPSIQTCKSTVSLWCHTVNVLSRQIEGFLVARILTSITKQGVCVCGGGWDVTGSRGQSAYGCLSCTSLAPQLKISSLCNATISITCFPHWRGYLGGFIGYSNVSCVKLSLIPTSRLLPSTLCWAWPSPQFWFVGPVVFYRLIY